MPEGPRWVELTRAVGEINARLIAGDLENEEIRTHIELEGSAWLYAGEDPNRMATIYVLEGDVDRARQVLAEAAAGEFAGGEEVLARESDHPDEDFEEGYEDRATSDYPILAEGETGFRSRPLRWLIAALVAGALVFGLLRETSLDFLDLAP